MIKPYQVKLNGRHLEIYIKMRWFDSYATIAQWCDFMFSTSEAYLGASIDATASYVVATFMLRDKEDVLPYVREIERLEGEIKKRGRKK